MTHFKIHFISVLKIDVQGYEISVLRGADSALREKRIGAVFAENDELLTSNSGNKLHDVYEYLTTRGYDPYPPNFDCFDIVRDKFLPNGKCEPMKTNQGGPYDILWLPRKTK